MYTGGNKEYELSSENKLFKAIKDIEEIVITTKPIAIQFTAKTTQRLINFHNANITCRVTIDNLLLYGVKVSINKNNTIRDHQVKLIYTHGREKIIDFLKE